MLLYDVVLTNSKDASTFSWPVVVCFSTYHILKYGIYSIINNINAEWYNCNNIKNKINVKILSSILKSDVEEPV